MLLYWSNTFCMLGVAVAPVSLFFPENMQIGLLGGIYIIFIGVLLYKLDMISKEN